jgi:hypothetical protein
MSVMCPDKKLNWFNDNEDWREEDRLEVDRIVRTRWTETYLKCSPSPSHNSTQKKPEEKVGQPLSITYEII